MNQDIAQVTLEVTGFIRMLGEMDLRNPSLRPKDASVRKDTGTDEIWNSLLNGTSHIIRGSHYRAHAYQTTFKRSTF